MGIRGVAGGIGLASESWNAHKESKAAKGEESGPSSASHEGSDKHSPSKRDVVPADDPPPTSHGEPSDEKGSHDQVPDKKAVHALDESHTTASKPEGDLEEEWDLDDAQDEIIEETPKEDAPQDGTEIEDTFLRDHPLPKDIKDAHTGSLLLPVVLPQRRPKDRSRGFIRAYAPVLENCGIDQATWLAFLDTFQKSSAANPWLNAINMASIATMFIPHGFGMLVSYAIQQATNVAIEFQARER